MKRLGLDKYVIHRDILQTPSAKVLCDIYEAIIGGINLLPLYLNCNFILIISLQQCTTR